MFRVQRGIIVGGPHRLGFFLEELKESLNFKSLLDEAYILVSKLGFDYPSVKQLTRRERSYYLDLYLEEKDAEARAMRET